MVHLLAVRQSCGCRQLGLVNEVQWSEGRCATGRGWNELVHHDHLDVVERQPVRGPRLEDELG